MNTGELFDYCQSVQGAEAATPCDEVTIVMEVMGWNGGYARQ